MSAIANISAALGYDTVESALVSGSLADACRAAGALYATAPVGDDTAPESCNTLAVVSSVEPSTVRPGKWNKSS